LKDWTAAEWVWFIQDTGLDRFVGTNVKKDGFPKSLRNAGSVFRAEHGDSH
jgi:hypothetical protein